MVGKMKEKFRPDMFSEAPTSPYSTQSDIYKIQDSLVRHLYFSNLPKNSVIESVSCDCHTLGLTA